MWYLFSIFFTSYFLIRPAFASDKFSPVTWTPEPQTLTLYFYTSPIGIRWRTPQALVRSTIENQIAKGNRKIGHASVQIECTDENQRIHSEFTGMTSIGNTFNEQILKKHYGLGVLFSESRGSLESAAKLRAELPEKLRRGTVSFVQFQISQATCSRITRYLAEYREANLDRRYGLPNRPTHKEGAGCSAFAASFLEVAGLLNQSLIHAWSRTLRVPKKLVGGPMTKRKVRLVTLLSPTSGPRHWASPTEAGFPIFFFDPERMYRWVHQQWNAVNEQNRIRRGRAIGIRVDQSDHLPPTGPIWTVPLTLTES